MDILKKIRPEEQDFLEDFQERLFTYKTDATVFTYSRKIVLMRREKKKKQKDVGGMYLKV